MAALYLNGALEEGPLAIPDEVSPFSPLRFGDDPFLPGGEPFEGMIDEAQFYRTARGGDWMKLLYATQKAGAAVVQVGPAEAASSEFK